MGWTRAVEAPLRQALEIYRGWYGQDHPRTASALNDLAVILVGLKRYDEAEPLLREALAIRERLHGSEHPSVGETLHALSSLVYFRRQYGEAAELCRRVQRRRALAIFQAALPADHVDVAAGEGKLGFALYQQGRLAEAEPHLSRALQVTARRLGPGVPLAVELRQLLTASYTRLGRRDEAARLEAERQALEAGPPQEEKRAPGVSPPGR
jgi:tetratricopeptide (TPR) repeat protein